MFPSGPCKLYGKKMQLSLAHSYQSRCLVVKEVLGYERCQMALDRFSKRREWEEMHDCFLFPGHNYSAPCSTSACKSPDLLCLLAKMY